MRTLTVRELISELEQFDDATPVHFGYNYGDYWKTMVAPGVVRAEQMAVKHSDYHSMPRIADDDDEEYGELPQAVVLFS